jgi:hypothetical protein
MLKSFLSKTTCTTFKLNLVTFLQYDKNDTFEMMKLVRIVITMMQS